MRTWFVYNVAISITLFFGQPHFGVIHYIPFNYLSTCTVVALRYPFRITMSEAPHKAHRPSQSGKKAEKKDVAKGKDRSGGSKGFNEKVSIR